nr:MAG TPA: structural protein [Bacteriophage sp.]
MAKYFLASVGTAEAFRRVNGELQLAFRSKTLTDSGINITTTKDDIRAGTGAPIQFSFYHDPNVEITLTDVLFDQAYVEAQLGTQFKVGGDKYESETVTGTSATLKYDPVALNMGCGKSEVVIWYTEEGKDDWKILESSEIQGKTITLPEEKSYCIRYVRHDASSQIAEISSDMIPEELFLVITAPIYAGDACSASNGKAAGTITYEIPRFKLNGAQEFTMNMSSNQTMSLSGVALASADGCDITGARLLRIITNYDGVNWYDNVTELIADEDYLKVGDVPHIYALFTNGSVSLVDNEELTFTPALADKKWSTAGAQKIAITAKPSIEDDVTIQ